MLRKWGIGVAVLAIYLVATRIGLLEAAKIGFTIGGLPLFLSELTCLTLLTYAVLKRPRDVAYYSLTGKGYGPVGQATWLILIIALVYLIVSFPRHGVFAARDFAIYSYALFFPLTLMVIQSREDVERLLKLFIYSGVVLAFWLVFESITGVSTGFFEQTTRSLFGGSVRTQAMGSGDTGGVIAFSMAGLLAYATLETRHRAINIACILLCAFAITIPQTRSAIVGLGLAGLATFVIVRGNSKVIFLLAGVSLFLLFVLSPSLPSEIPGVQSLRNLYVAVISGFGDSNDGNASYRLIRWSAAWDIWLENWFFGVGFGARVLPTWLIENDVLDTFNGGLPHNSFLTILARTGVVGLPLFLFSWGYIVSQLFKSLRFKRLNTSRLAVLNILLTMFGFSNFVLFFERPMHGVSFWILCAMACALLRYDEIPDRTYDVGP